MSNLNYTIFYKAKFMISSTYEGADLLWDFIFCIRQWQIKKWNKVQPILDENFKTWSSLKNGGRIFSVGGSGRPVYIESEYFAPSENTMQHFGACKISEKIVKESGYCERDWITEIGFRQFKSGAAEICCLISYGDLPGFIGLYEDTPAPTVPKLISVMLKNDRINCYSGIDKIENTALELRVGDFPDFKTSLLNPERDIPYIYISPRRISADSDEAELLVNPNRLAYVVCGNAKVFFSNDFAFTQEMSYFFDCKQYCCYGGSVRVYTPKLDDKNESDSIRHRSLHPSFIEDVGENETLLIYRRALAQNVNFYESYFGINQCIEMKKDAQRKQRLEDLRKSHAQEIAELQDSKLDEAIAEEEKRLIAEQTIVDLMLQISATNERCFNLERQVTGMTAAAAKAGGLEKALAAREVIKTYPTSSNDIVQYFESYFADKIAFTDSAIKSLKRCKFPAKDL